MKKIYFLIFLFFALLNHSKAQNCQSQRYISEIFSNTQSHTGIKFGEADPYGLINNQDLYLDIVEPAGDSLQKRPLIIHAFGGGFLIGWRTEPVIPQMSESYAKRGFVFATIDYRLGFNVADGQSAERAVYRGAQDMAAALRFLVDSADVYGIDTSAIFLTGTSAGCFSALINGFMEESDRANINSTYGIFLEPDDLGCLQ
ncbi:MAG: carboxylesterase family protein [Chitinophagales bacterium]